MITLKRVTNPSYYRQPPQLPGWARFLVALRSWLVRAARPTTGRLAGLAGLVLIAAGGVCLYKSAKAPTGSWSQSTLDAFGVGLVVGGIVDVLAITLLNQFFSSSRQHWNNQADGLLAEAKSYFAPIRDEDIKITITHVTPDEAERGAAIRAQARELLYRRGEMLDPVRRSKLEQLVRSFGYSD